VEEAEGEVRGMGEIEQALQSVRDVFVNFPKKIEEHQEALKKIDQEITDIEHAIEIHSFNASKGYYLAKELQKARLRRRAIKDEIELLGPIKEFLSYAKPTEKVINKTIKDLKGITELHKIRLYKMRVREDLQELVMKNE
jgi:Na+/phosphate symporter